MTKLYFFFIALDFVLLLTGYVLRLNLSTVYFFSKEIRKPSDSPKIRLTIDFGTRLAKSINNIMITMHLLKKQFEVYNKSLFILIIWLTLYASSD